MSTPPASLSPPNGSIHYSLLSRLMEISSWQKSIALALIDICISIITLSLAFWIGNNTHPSLMILPYIVGFSLSRVFIFHLFRLYRRLWRYASITALRDIVIAVSVSTLGLLIYFPTRVVFLEWSFALLGIGGFRLALRILRDHWVEHDPDQSIVCKRIVIIGAGDAGVTVKREMRRSKALRYEVLGFLDDDPRKQNQFIQGIKVLGKISDLPHLVSRFDLEEAIIALPSAGGAVIRRIVGLCEASGISGKITPGLFEIISGRVPIDQVRDVRIEDLLGRDVVEEALTLTLHSLEHDSILVTGAGGSIGAELSRQLCELSPKVLILLDKSEHALYLIDQEIQQRATPKTQIISIVADIQNVDRMDHIFKRYEITMVYHAAAYKHVPLMELNIVEAISNNIVGTRSLIDAAARFNVKRFVLISTDKAVNPTSVMGASKRICERIMQDYSKKRSTIFTAVRFGNVLGSSGSVVPLFKRQIQQGGPITVTHPEMTRYFMTIPEAVRLVIQAGYLAKGGEIFILDMGEPVKILNLAKDMIYLSGLKETQDIDIVFTGLRPGEKLFEELQLDSESLIATSNPKIFMTPPLPVDPQLESKIDSLSEPNQDSEDLRLSLLKIASE